jgi:hypothetical protein
LVELRAEPSPLEDLKRGFGQNVLSFFHALRQASENATGGPDRKGLYFDYVADHAGENAAPFPVKKSRSL